MGCELSTANAITHEMIGREQRSTISRDRDLSRRGHTKMIQNVLLIWLDKNIKEDSKDCQNTITQLRHVVNEINTFIDEEQCIQFLNKIPDEKACIIISGALGEVTVRKVHSMSQVDSIFIFCNNQKYHEQWTKEWSKIKGVFTEIIPICNALKQAAQQCEQNSISISFMRTKTDLAIKNLDQLDSSFMYTQILKEILLSIKFSEKHKKEFIDFYRERLDGNSEQLLYMDEFQRTYNNQKAIYWYTYECFLYSTLNRALRLLDADLIIKLGFFINDLHQEIEQLHNEQFDSRGPKKTITVYRGQGMDKEEFEKMRQTQGGLLSFNSFLSTTTDREVARGFAHRALKNPDMAVVIFIMEINPVESTTPFASIAKFSAYKENENENEVLFSMHTVFRINKITPTRGDQRIYDVNLTLTSDNDKDLRVLTDRIRAETFPDTEGWFRLGLVLMKLGEFNKANEVYQILLQQVTDEASKASIYHQMGLIKCKNGQYEEGIEYYKKSIEIEEKMSSPNHRNIANTYNNIGALYDSLCRYPEALSSHQKALEIRQQSLPEDDPDMAMSYNNIGVAHEHMKEYAKALTSYEKALEIQKRSLPSAHPDLAYSYDNMGLVYNKMGKSSEAFSFCEKALEIRQKSLTTNHPTLASSYNNIGEVQLYMGEYSNALTSFEKTQHILKKAYSSNHPHFIDLYKNIGMVHEKQGDYSKARSYYKHALDIGQQVLSPDNSKLQKCQENLDRIKEKV